MSQILIKLLKYCVTGFSGMAVDFGVTWLLKEKLCINKYIASTAGFILAATSNFFINRTWTFQVRNDNISPEYISFVSIALLGLVVNNIIIYFLTDRLRYHFYASKFAAIIIVTLWNFFMNYFFTFSSSHKSNGLSFVYKKILHQE